MFKFIILSVFFAVAAADGAAWSFGFDIDYGTCNPKTNVAQCFNESHAAVRPCLAGLFQNPNYQKCRSNPAFKAATGDWMASSQKWHQLLVDCMKGNRRVKRQAPQQSLSTSDQCFAGVKAAMDKCHNDALKCDKYAKCYNQENVVKARAEKEAKQQIMEQALNNC